GFVNYVAVPVHVDLAKRMKLAGGILPVTGGRNLETTVVSIFEDIRDPQWRCLLHFGYSTNGTSVFLTPQKEIGIVANESPEIIARQSLQKLFQITRDSRFFR
ncbi:MAG: hypothetical protein NZM26_05240, partial [Patescibacteria group bacterium]|nr:hypothetical protein [Patescibacteria group bacterium]